MFPATCDDVVLTSGACEVTVIVSCSAATFNATRGAATFWPTSNSTSAISTVENPASSIRTL
jgi:hypothetical protein